MGTCGVYARENTDNAPDIGFAFLPEFEGKGYGYESAHFMKNLVKNDYGIKKLGGITVEYNHAPRKLLEKLGLKFQKNSSWMVIQKNYCISKLIYKDYFKI